MKSRSDGTTLVELLVVLAIASIALALVVPAVRAGRSELQLRNAVRVLSGALNVARNRAIFRQHSILVQFDEAHARIYISDPSEETPREIQLPETIQIKVTSGSTEGQITHQTETALPSFDFQPDGGVPEMQIEVASGNRERQIRTDPLTGVATVK
jgi:type II secretion system protein H